jgi:hypothetical protein
MTALLRQICFILVTKTVFLPPKKIAASNCQATEELLTKKCNNHVDMRRNNDPTLLTTTREPLGP